MEKLGTRIALFVRAFYWPESARLRVALAVVAGAWFLVAAEAASVGPEGNLLGAYGWDATLTWAALRLAVADRGGRLVPRLPLTWRGTRLGRTILPWQLGISALVLLGDLINWADRTRMATATNDLSVTLLAAAVVWAAPAVLVALKAYDGLLSSLFTWPEPPRAGLEQGAEAEWAPPPQDMPADPSWTDWPPRTPPPFAPPPDPVPTAPAWAPRAPWKEQVSWKEQGGPTTRPPAPRPAPAAWGEDRPGAEAADPEPVVWEEYRPQGDDGEPDQPPDAAAYAMPLAVAYMLTGLTPGASAEQIKQRRRALMKQTHADPNRVHRAPAAIEEQEQKTALLLEAFRVIAAQRHGA